MAKQITLIPLQVLKDANNWSSRKDRMLRALLPGQPDHFMLDNRSIKDMVTFIKELAKQIQYYDLFGNKAGNWSGFLKNITPEYAQELIDKVNNNSLSEDEHNKLRDLLSAHEVLFLTFLSLMRHPQKQMNKLTKRYLDYYYRDCLNLKENSSMPAKAHVTFEPAYGAEKTLIKKGTILDAGKDSKGAEILYETDDDLLVTQAQITTIKTLSGIKDGFVLTTIFDQEKDKSFTPKAFKTFGEYKKDETKTELGFAISSPILLTNSGMRTLTLTLNLAGILNIKDIFTYYITGEEGWIKLAGKASVNTNELIFTLDKAVSYPEEYDCGIKFNNSYPILKAVLNDLGEYEQLKSIKIISIDLKLETKDVTDLKISNDVSVLNSNATNIYPFGSQPVQGSSFYFTHPELMGKKLSELKLRIDWLGLPQDETGFKAYYKGYTQNIDNDTFKVGITFYRNNIDLCPSKGKHNLFELDEKNKLKNSITINVIEQDNKVTDLSNVKPPEQVSDNPLDWPGYFALSLDHDFLHSMYLRKLVELGVEARTLNPPYTPCFRVTIASYSAVDTFTPEFDTQFIHLGPMNSDVKDSLLPNYPKFGCLLLGITRVQPGTSVSMAWQVSDLIAGETKVSWGLLDNEWQEYTTKDKDFILKDTTGGLSGSGIITFQIPENTNNKNRNPLTSIGQYWLRAVLDEGKSSVNTLDIKLHSTIASLTGQNKNQDDFSSLEAGTIKGLAEENPDIKKVLQPYAGFDGRKAENEQDLYMRASTRLKTKGRAITSQDYERLVFEAFPEISMVKVFNQRDSKEYGKLIIYVVASPDQTNFFSWPQASKQLLEKIKDYLQKYVSPFVRLEVKNAELESIECIVEVYFKKGNKDLYNKRLKEDLERFFLPWGNNTTARAIDSPIYKPEVINFIKTRDYIDQVLELTFNKN